MTTLAPEVYALRAKVSNEWYLDSSMTRKQAAKKANCHEATISEVIRADPRYDTDPRSHGYKKRMKIKAINEKAIRIAQQTLADANIVAAGIVPVQPSANKPVVIPDQVFHPISPQYRDYEDKLKTLKNKTKEVDKALIDKFNEQFVDMEKAYQKKLKLLEILNS